MPLVPWPTCVPKGCRIIFQPTTAFHFLPASPFFSAPGLSLAPKLLASQPAGKTRKCRGVNAPKVTRALGMGANGQIPSSLLGDDSESCFHASGFRRGSLTGLASRARGSILLTDTDIGFPPFPVSLSPLPHCASWGSLLKKTPSAQVFISGCGEPTTNQKGSLVLPSYPFMHETRIKLISVLDSLFKQRV